MKKETQKLFNCNDLEKLLAENNQGQLAEDYNLRRTENTPRATLMDVMMTNYKLIGSSRHNKAISVIEKYGV